MSASALYEAGYTDLVSVVPPDGRLSAGSKIREEDLGKAPARKYPSGWGGYGWRTKDVSPEELERTGANVGLRGERFPGLDIDVDHPKLAYTIQVLARKNLGAGPIRTSREPRRLLPYRAAEPISKMRLTVEHEGRWHAVEWLGSGQQYLVSGRHPSGADYGWAGAPLWETPADELPEVTREEVAAFFDHLQQRLESIGLRVERSGTGDASDAPPQESLKAPSQDALVMLPLPPNPDHYGWDEFIEHGYAYRAAGQDCEAAAFARWLAWAEQHPDFDPDVCEHEWPKLKPPFRVGYSWLAEQAGHSTAADDFEPIPVPEGEEVAAPEPDGDLAYKIVELLRRVPLGKVRLALEKLREALADRPEEDRPLYLSAAEHELARRVGRAEAKRLLRGDDERHRPFERVDGELSLRIADPRDMAAEPEPLAEGIPSAAVGMVSAPFSLGKSWLTIDLALSVAFGLPWFDADVQEGPVILLVAEGQAMIWKRLASWLVERELLPRDFTTAQLHEALDGRLVVAARPPQLDDPDLEPGLTATVERTGARLVVVDTLGKLLGVEQEENDNDTANEITGMLSRVSAATGVTALLVHHSGHGDKGRARGASGWEQGVDFAYTIAGSAAGFSAGVPVELRCRKQRDDRWPAPRYFALRPVRFRMNGREADGAVIDVVKSLAAELRGPAEVYAWIEENPGKGKRALRDGVGGDANAIDDDLQELIRLGAVENRPTGRGHSYHIVPGWRVASDGRTVEEAGAEFEPVDVEGDE